MVKALTFKGDKKAKKRKRTQEESADPQAPTSKQLAASTRAGIEEDDDTWVSADTLSDISGPVMLILPSSSSADAVHCLATDAMGKVHASAVENVVDNSPYTAEPHLVSQVWIATKVVGSEGDFTFKGHHGRYLGVDKFGFCSAMREAISPEETFKCSPAPPSTTAEESAAADEGLFNIQTTRRTFLTISPSDSTSAPPEVRGDATDAGSLTGLRVRMQARFKPRHQMEKAEKVRAKISRKALEEEVGRRLEDEEVKRLKKARREGDFHEAVLDVKVKGKHDKFA